MAFKGRAIQLALADIETQIYKKSIEAIEIESPVFIAGLPRSGTSVLLQALSSLSAFTSPSYRQMPFVLCPLLWDNISCPFRKNSDFVERAHGDGLKINYDSPEAFEEVVWNAFWGEKYHKDSIDIFGVQRRTSFEDYYLGYIKKILAISSKENPRYLSKNNANISRLSIIKEIFKDAKIIVPFREPRQHAASLLKQHLRFLEIHKEDRFSKSYMDYLGHYEFGELHRPFNFEGRPSGDPRKIDYWISYWESAYQHLLKQDGVFFLDYDRLCEESDVVLSQLSEFLNTSLVDLSEDFLLPRVHDVDVELDSGVVGLYQELKSKTRR